MKPYLKKYQDSSEARWRLFKFYRQVYATMPEMIDEDRFCWQSFENPFEKAEERPLIWYLESQEGEIVGHNSIFKYPMTIDGREYNGYCSTNLVVIPGTEGRGIGHILIESNEKLDGVAFAYGPTPASLSAFQKRGWAPLHDARLHTIILNPFKSLRFLRKSVCVALIAAPLLKMFSWILQSFRLLSAGRKPDGVTLRHVDRFEPNWDKYWDSYLQEFGLYYIRRSDFLNYKYASRRDVKHKILIFEKDQRPVGFIVYRTSASDIKKIRLGRIVELVSDPSMGADLIDYMVRMAIDQLLKDRVDSIVAVSCSQEIRKAYRKNGMFISRPQIMLVKETDFLIANIRPRYKNIWHLSLGDADIDNYW